jgi:hypothetical protein
VVPNENLLVQKLKVDGKGNLVLVFGGDTGEGRLQGIGSGADTGRLDGGREDMVKRRKVDEYQEANEGKVMRWSDVNDNGPNPSKQRGGRGKEDIQKERS